jgi:hypothetical protein
MPRFQPIPPHARTDYATANNANIHSPSSSSVFDRRLSPRTQQQNAETRIKIQYNGKQYQEF